MSDLSRERPGAGFDPQVVASIRVITFDLDDTLWDVWPIIERAEKRLQTWLQLHYPQIAARYDSLGLRGLSAEIEEQQPEQAYRRSWLRKRTLALAARRCGYQDFDVEAAFQVFYRARNEVRFFEEVEPVLSRLAQRYTLGALSNGNACAELTGLSEYLTFALNAEGVGCPKPGAAMFEEARRLSGFEPEQILHVGDEPEHDVSGASKAGFRTVWINRSGKAWPTEMAAEPDATVTSMTELERMLVCHAHSTTGAN